MCALGKSPACCTTVAVALEGEWETLKAQVRASPVLDADETGWREDDQNGYIWAFVPPATMPCAPMNMTPAGAVVKRILAGQFQDHLVSDFYGGYNIYPSQHLIRTNILILWRSWSLVGGAQTVEKDTVAGGHAWRVQGGDGGVCCFVTNSRAHPFNMGYLALQLLWGVSHRWLHSLIDRPFLRRLWHEREQSDHEYGAA